MIIPGIVVKEVNVLVVDKINEREAERGTQENATRELERVGKFCLQTEDTILEFLDIRGGGMSLPALIIIIK
jgi:hypothetical protein